MRKNNTLFLIAVVNRRHAHLLLEESAKGRGVGEVEIVGDFLNALVCVVDKEDGFLGYCLKDKLLYGAA